MHTCMHIHTYTHTVHTYVHTYIRTYIHTYIRMYIHKYMHVFIHTCVHTYIHQCIHIYTVYTYTCTVHSHIQDSSDDEDICRLESFFILCDMVNSLGVAERRRFYINNNYKPLFYYVKKGKGYIN